MGEIINRIRDRFHNKLSNLRSWWNQLTKRDQVTIVVAIIVAFSTVVGGVVREYAASIFQNPSPTSAIAIILTPTPTTTLIPTATETAPTLMPTAKLEPTTTPTMSPTRIVENDAEEIQPPTINPWPENTSGKIAFVRKGGFYIGEFDENKKQIVNSYLISKIDDNFGNPRMAPDGSKIAFSSQHDKTEDIYTIGRDGNSFNNVSREVGFTNTFSAWSPDGTKLLITAQYSDGTMNLIMVNSDGSDPRTLVEGRHTSAAIFSQSPFSPNSPKGQKIIYSSTIMNTFETTTDTFETSIKTFDLWTVDSDGTDLLPITTDPKYSEKGAVWSPDGRKIAYTHDADLVSNSEIYLLDVSAGSSSVPINLTEHAARDQDPAWFPDGRKLLFISYRTGNWDIYMMNIDGTGVFNLTNTNENEDNPLWLP